MGIREFEVDGQTYEYEYDALEGRPSSVVKNGTKYDFKNPSGGTVFSMDIKNVQYIGESPTTSTADDTVAKWAEVGSGVFYVGKNGILIDQPNQYGILLNMSSGYDLHQIFFVQRSGSVYHRGGNVSAGWGSSWKMFHVSEDGNLADHVVENGVSALGWNYRKWSSGWIELWKAMKTTYAVTDAWNNAYFHADYATVDTGLVKSLQCAYLTPQRSSGLYSVSVYALTNNRISFYVWSPKSEASADIYMHMYVIGYWK